MFYVLVVNTLLLSGRQLIVKATHLQVILKYYLKYYLSLRKG